MAIERADVRVVRKPWGSIDLKPWCDIHDKKGAIGELWFQRNDPNAPAPALLLKLLFTNEPLSIQVHPDDAFARSIGLKHGKSEAWYILSATPDAKIGLGLKRRLTAAQLRDAIEDGSISDLVQWHGVQKDDTIFVPPGTIHAIGAGLVVAEIQQRSDTTFRLFDYGRDRELHVEHGVAVANAGPVGPRFGPTRINEARTLLVASPHFVLERINLSANSSWEMRAERETWLLVIEGYARIDLLNTFVGETTFLDADRAAIKAGSGGLTCLVAYLGPVPRSSLLRNLDREDRDFPVRPFSRPPIHAGPTAGSSLQPMETSK